MPFRRALIDGLTLQFRLYVVALKKPGPHRQWVIVEGVVIALLAAAAVISLKWTILPALYAILMIAGSWIFPIVTVLIPHNASGTDELTRTRLFRGKLLSLLAFEHLYHLEHHLYPQVPHHNWPELARRLDPHFARLGLQPIKLLI
jgi:beta-carotene hydroxylase